MSNFCVLVFSSPRRAHAAREAASMASGGSVADSPPSPERHGHWQSQDGQDAIGAGAGAGTLVRGSITRKCVLSRRHPNKGSHPRAAPPRARVRHLSPHPNIPNFFTVHSLREEREVVRERDHDVAVVVGEPLDAVEEPVRKSTSESRADDLICALQGTERSPGPSPRSRSP